MNFLSSLRQFIRRHDLIPDNARVVVGVSGGPDSLALLHALHQLAPEHGWQLHAATLNHGLRPEAEAETHFVAELAAAWGLGCTVEQADVRALAAQPGVSLEEAARLARYAFLGRVAQRLGAPVIAVGHHADDQVETILMHLLRGSGLAGLRGMPPSVALGRLRLSSERIANPPPELPAHQPDSQSGGGSCDDVHLVRPLLAFTREEILAYCRAHDLEPRWDESNQDETFFRNRLRHGLIPQLKAINPNLTATLSRTAFALQGDYEALDARRRALWATLAREEPGRVRLALSPFRALLRGDQRALLRRAMAALRPKHRNISWEHTERVLDVLAAHPQRASGGPYTLTAGLEAWLSYDWLDVQEPDFIPGDVPQIEEPRPLTLPGELTLNPGWRLTARAVTWRPGEEAPWRRRSSPDVIWLPAEIPAPLLLRPRRPGDYMRPLGLGGDKTIKDLMNERRIPRAARPRWPLLTDAAGGILWLVGSRASELAQTSPDAGRAWEITLTGQVNHASIRHQGQEDAGGLALDGERPTEGAGGPGRSDAGE
jgi:tRNA(Ile)-lysidine synthase